MNVSAINAGPLLPIRMVQEQTDGKLLMNVQSVGLLRRPVGDFGKISLTLTLAFGLADDEYKFPVIVMYNDKYANLTLLTKSEILAKSDSSDIQFIDLNRREDDRRWHDRCTGTKNDPRKS